MLLRRICQFLLIYLLGVVALMAVVVFLLLRS